MKKPFQKLRYDSNPAFKLHYTKGAHEHKATPTFLHYDTDYIIDYFRQGSGNMKIEGNLYKINAGDIFILNPRELHISSLDDGKYHERIVLHVNNSILEYFPYDGSELFASFCKRRSGIGNHIPAEDVKKFGLDKFFEKILSLAQAEKPASQILLICKIIELLSELNRVVLPNYSGSENGTLQNPVINEVLYFINNNFRRNLNLTDIAAAFYLSKYHLCHLFKQYVGISLYDYIILKRIHLFNDLVRNNHSIEEACLSAGFHNYSNFYRLYKKHMNMTPIQFKKTNAKKDTQK